MTGPARIAWIICAAVCACPLYSPAFAAAPSDAVKPMPGIYNQLQMYTRGSQSGNGREYTDRFNDDWYIDWNPPGVTLGSNASLTWQSHFEMHLADVDSGVAGGDISGTRGDKNQTTLQLNAGAFTSRYVVVNEDYSSAGPGAPRQWSGNHSETTGFTWSPPGLPAFAAWRDYRRSFTYNQAAPAGISEFEAYHWNTAYQRDDGAFGQRAFIQSDIARSQSFVPQGTPSRSSRTALNGYRTFPLGAAGTLSLSYDLADSHSSDQGSVTERNDFTGNYGLSLNGNVRDYPLRYGFGYQTAIYDSNAGGDTTRRSRQLSLQFSPPAPPGRASAFTFSSNRDEVSNDPGRLAIETAYETQALQWDFTANKQVGGTFRYEMKNTTSPASYVRTQDRYQFNGGLRYNMPKNRGTLNMGYYNIIDSNPSRDTTGTASGLDLNSNFPLKGLGNIVFFYNRHYDQYQGTHIAMPSNNEYLVSGITYNFRPASMLSLNATWQQQLHRISEETVLVPRSSTIFNQLLNVTLSYYPIPGWSYQLAYAGNDESRSDYGSVTGRDYNSSNEITLTVAHSF